MRCPKFAHPPFRSANFDRGTRFCLAQSAFCGARQRVPRHAPRAECSITSIVQKETSAAVAVLVFFGRGRRTQPFAVPEIRLPSLSLGEFRPRHPLSARFFRFRGAHQRAPRLAPPAECSIINTVQKETSAAVAVLVFFGRGRRTRTLGTRFWRPLLYQLSYTPISRNGLPFFRYCEKIPFLYLIILVGHQGLEPRTNRL